MPSDAAPGRVWVPALPAAGAVLTLGEADARYLRRVCRARPGERVELADGAGGLARAVLVLDGTALTARIESRETLSRPHERRLLCGAPEGERADWMVEKLAEFGVLVLQPLDTARARWERFGRRGERFERLAVAALRQSLRAFRMEILAPLPLARALEAVPAGARRWLADPEGVPAQDLPAFDGPVAGLVGPSSGLTADEQALCVARGFQPISLARARLRTETAALALAARWDS